MSRVLILCNDIKKCNDTILRASKVAKNLGAKATILFVHEPDFFDIFDFKKDNSLDKEAVKKHLQTIANEAGLEDSAVIVEIGDSANWVELESKREEDTIIITSYEDKITNSVIKAVDIPILILKNSKSNCKRLLIATDAQEFTKPLTLLDKLGCNVKLAYYDTQLIPIPTLNSGVEFVGTIDIDVELYQEEVDSIEKNFKNFCKEYNIEAIFNTNEESVDINVLAQVLENGADTLSIILEDRESLLSAYVEDIVNRANVNLFIATN